MQSHSNQETSTARRVFLLAAALCVGAIGWFLLGESETVTAEETPKSNVLATVNGKAITEAELREELAGEFLKLDRQRHDLLADSARNEVRNRLVDAEAEKRGVTKEELLDTEVTAKVTEVSDDEINAFYEERKAQIRAPMDQVRPQIRQYLAQQKGLDAYQALIDSLESKYEVKYFIEPFRIDVAAEGPSKGPADAEVTIVEFSDFECPFCGRVNPTLAQVQDTYGDKVRVVFRQFPLAIHANARKAGEASLCANDQGKFWEMHDGMFEDQRNLTVDGLKTIAGKIEGLDTESFASCLDSGKYADQVEADFQAGTVAGVSGTPAFFINGRFLNGAQPFEEFSRIIDEELEMKGS